MEAKPVAKATPIRAKPAPEETVVEVAAVVLFVVEAANPPAGIIESNDIKNKTPKETKLPVNIFFANFLALTGLKLKNTPNPIVVATNAPNT
jgi:hypothetical protein